MAYEVERRQGGCDIRRPAPPPVFQDDEARYEDVAAREGGRLRLDGGGGVGRAAPRDERAGGLFAFLGGCVAALVAVWVYSVSAPFLAAALTLHGWRLWVSVALACAPALLVLALLASALVRLRRLPRLVQLEADAFTNKAELQRLLADAYLARFPDPERYAADNGFAGGAGDRARQEVVGCLRRLRGTVADSRGWLIEFARFQELQDGRAKEIVARAWKLVAIKTAASPWKIVDMLAVIYNSTVMIVRLARLYNRRVSRPAAFRLACRWIVNIYIAGEMGDATQGAVEWAGANELISATYKPLAGLVGKVAEGGANAFLVYRLGLRAMDAFRPLR